MLKNLYYILLSGFIVYNYAGLGFAASQTNTHLDCTLLTGAWQGTYVENTNLYGKPTPWPIHFNLYYSKKTHIVYGEANTPFVPSTVSPDNKINYTNQAPAKIIGYCQKGAITQLLLINPLAHCGHYTQPGGQLLNPKTLILHLDYEFSMNEAQFTVSLYKIDRKISWQSLSQAPPPKINTCH